MNSVTVIGRLVADPELRYLNNGTAVTSIRIAVDRAGNKQEDGTFAAGFFDVTCWGRTAELVAEYLAKGRQLGVSGELRHNTWKDRDTGDNRSRVEINARNITFVGNRGEDGGGGSPPRNDEPPMNPDDDIPF